MPKLLTMLRGSRDWFPQQSLHHLHKCLEQLSPPQQEEVLQCLVVTVQNRQQSNNDMLLTHTANTLTCRWPIKLESSTTSFQSLCRQWKNNSITEEPSLPLLRKFWWSQLQPQTVEHWTQEAAGVLPKEKLAWAHLVLQEVSVHVLQMNINYQQKIF